jgi:hypothetical protein
VNLGAVWTTRGDPLSENKNKNTPFGDFSILTGSRQNDFG